jgi:prepilin-type N-terminal cleavage/methylation domain-containing protein
MIGQRGFTLIEVMVAMAVVTILGVVLMQLLVQNNSIFFSQSSQISQGLALNDGISIITSDIKNSASVASGYPDPSPTITSGQNSIVLAIPSLDSNNQVIDQTFDYETISADTAIPTVLREQLYPAAQSSRKAINHVLTTALSSINFNYLDLNGNPVTPTAATKVSVTVNLSTKTGSNNQQNSARATVSLRNN